MDLPETKKNEIKLVTIFSNTIEFARSAHRVTPITKLIKHEACAMSIPLFNLYFFSARACKHVGRVANDDSR